MVERGIGMSSTKSLYEVTKDISEKMGISKQAVNKRVKKELGKGQNKLLVENTEIIKNDDKTSIRLNERAVMAVYELYNLVDQPVTQPVTQPVDQPVDQHNRDGLLASTIEVLQEQLKIKDEQIKAKDEQLATLSKLVENSQVLLKNEQAKNNPALLSDGESGSEPEAAKKRSIIDKILRRS